MLAPTVLKDGWRWLFVAAAVALAAAIVLRSLSLACVAVSAAGAAAAWCRLETGRWPTAFASRWWKDALARLRFFQAALVARFDDAPGYWRGPPRDDVHAGYRRDYEALVRERHLDEGKIFYLAQLIDGLRRYGDDPLTKPPKPRGIMSARLVGGAWSGALGRYGLMAGLGLVAALVAACAVLWGRTAMLERQRDAACTEFELDGFTSRQACRDLARAAARIEEVEADLAAEETARVIATERAAIEAQATRELNQRNVERRRQSAERLRRAREDDLESARTARAPDWDERLRDLAEPAVGGTGEGDPSSGDDPAG
jgi:hypothetical protein